MRAIRQNSMTTMRERYVKRLRVAGQVREKWPLKEWPKQPWLAENVSVVRLLVLKEKIQQPACRRAAFTAAGGDSRQLW